MQQTVEGTVEFRKMRNAFRTDLVTSEVAAMIVAAHDGAMLELHRLARQINGRELIRALQFALVRGIEEKVDHQGLDRGSCGAAGTHP
ncbi:MAG: hypothetical protein EXQ91_03530 [Alphaproteobacteria bacterium]|nr:hypothetical protein [Alphaproteobacteria bacterium]